MQDNIITRQYICPECQSRDLIIEGTDTQICKSCGHQCRCVSPTDNYRKKVIVAKRDLNTLVGFKHKKAKEKSHQEIMAEIKAEKYQMCPKCDTFKMVKVPMYEGSKKEIYKCTNCNNFDRIENIEVVKKATFESVAFIGEPIVCPKCGQLTFYKSVVKNGKSIYMQCRNKDCNHFDKYLENKKGEMVRYDSIAEVLPEENTNGNSVIEEEEGDDEDEQ